MSADPKKLAMAYLENQQLEQLESYLKRGRSFAKTDTCKLRQRWLDEMKYWAENYGGSIDHCPREDVQAELRMRGLDPPLDAANNSIAQLKTKQSAHLERLKRADPAAFVRADRAIGDEIDRFANESKKTLN